jgi:hypothetical protein
VRGGNSSGQPSAGNHAQKPVGESNKFDTNAHQVDLLAALDDDLVADFAQQPSQKVWRIVVLRKRRNNARPDERCCS